MSLSDAAAKKLERWFWETPDGRTLAPLPWASVDDDEKARLPFFVRATGSLGAPLLLLGGFLLFISIFGAGRIAASFGTGLVVTIGLAYRRAWKRAGHVVIAQVSAPARVHERDGVSVIVTVRNDDTAPSGRVILRVLFDGSAQRERYFVEPPLARGETRRIKVELTADRGMGEHLLHPIDVVVSDDLKLFPLCTQHDEAHLVEVLPEASEGKPIEVTRASLAAHAGPYEARISGDSASFLGLRPFRVGDGVRRIDWKRSMRLGDLLVRDFERLLATDATIFVDQGPAGHSGFGGVSSMETMRDAALAFARGMLSQQMRVQLVTVDLHVPLGAGRGQEMIVEDAVRGLKIDPSVHFGKILSRHLPMVPPDSVVALFVCSRSVALADLWESLLTLEERRVEVVLVVIDSDRFAAAVKDAARLDERQGAVIEELKAAVSGSQPTNSSRLVARLVEHGYVIGPGETLAEASGLGGKR